MALRKWAGCGAGLLAAAAVAGCGLRHSSWRSQGRPVWVQAPDGRVKTRVYASGRLSGHPVLVVWLHGDLGPGDEHFRMAQLLARRTSNVVAVAVTRPGYTDADGDTSAGRKGHAIGDNYTAAVVDDVDAVARQLKARYQARAVVVMGHSGGAAIAADLMGRHPGDADAAVLIACNCDPRGFMARWQAGHPQTPSDLPNPSLQPLDLAAGVSPRAHVRLVVGSRDETVLVPPSAAYASALKARGVDVRLAVAPGADHVSVLSAAPTRAAVAEVLGMEGAKVLVTPP